MPQSAPPQGRPPASRAKTGSAMGRILAQLSAAASAAGIMASVSGLFLFTAGGLIALWAGHPTPATASTEQTAQVAASIARADMPLWRCVPEEPSSYQIDFNIHRGDITDISVSPASPTADCLVTATAQMRLAAIRGPLHVALPVTFR
jgi:hypothetical protein